MRRLLGLAVVLAGCLKPSAHTCRDGWTCPGGLDCVQAPTFCASPAEAKACSGAADFTACATDSVSAGYCQGGACQECVVDYGVCPAHAWTQMTYTGPDLASVFVTAPGKAIAVGAGGLAEWDGLSWTNPPAGASPLRAVSVPQIGGDAWAISSTDIYRWNGATLTSANTPAGTTLDGLWASSQSDVYAVGTGGTIVHGSGAIFSTAALASMKVLVGVGGSSSSDVYVVGSAGALAHLEAGAWVQKTVPVDVVTAAFKAVWADTPTDVFVVGTSVAGAATILHFDGTAWTHSPVDPTVGGINLRSVWGSGPSDVYAAGSDPLAMGGVIVHFDGQKWSPAATTAAALTSISGAGAGSGAGPHEVIAVGANHTVMRYTGP